MTRNPLRCHWVCFLLTIYCCACNLSLRIVCFVKGTPLENTDSCRLSGCQRWLLCYGWRHVFTFPFRSRTPSDVDPCRSFVSVSVFSYVWWSSWFRRLCFLGLLHPLWLLHFLPPLLYGPLSPEKGDLRETSSVELSVLRFYSLCNVWLESRS